MTLTLTGTNYVAEGPYENEEHLKEQSGVYIITTKNNDEKHRVIDIGESGKVKERISSHDRRNSWIKNTIKGLFFSVIYCNEQERMKKESELRDCYNPPCGER